MADQKLPTRAEDFSEWYNQLVTAGGAGGLRAGARVHDRAAVRLGLVGEHHGGSWTGGSRLPGT